MQFRRTAVAVAIAGIAALSPQIASADTVLSGAIGIQIGADDAETPVGEDGRPLEGEALEAALLAPDNDAPDSSDGRFALDEAVIGIVATHTMDNGLDAYGSVRFDGDGFSGSNVSDDNIYLGVRGAFGDIRLGEVPVGGSYGEVANDIFGINSGSNQGISYTGNFGPATIGANYSPARNEDQFGIGARFNVGGFAVAGGVQDRDELIEYSVGASFGFAGASIAAHFASSEVVEDGPTDDTEIVGLRIGYGIAGVAASLTYMYRESQDINSGIELDASVVRLDLSYGLGGGFNVSGRYTYTDADEVTTDAAGITTLNADDTDIAQYRLLLTKSF